MVIGKNFIWLHMGKTGGNSTKLMFEGLDGILYTDSIHDPKKHSNLTRTDIDATLLQDKKIICNIRKLPAWIKSYRQQRIVVHNKVLTLEELCMSAEGHIKTYSNSVDYWIRTEQLADDFIKIISNFIDISPEQEKNIRRIHINKRTYSHDLTQEDIDYLYDSCPTWKKYEEMVY